MFGTHIDSDPKKIMGEIIKYSAKGCNIIQLFVDPFFKSKKEYITFANFASQHNIKIICHISYSINCARQWDTNSWWINQFIMEIESANKLNAVGVVIHLGKQLSITKEEALNNMFQSLLYIHTQTKHFNNVKILIETSSGQGTEMCYMMEDLCHFFKKFSSHKSLEVRERFGLCLDTCHIFAAGYDIRSKKGIEKYFIDLNKEISLTNIKLLHMNDSKRDLNEKIDRHENLGYGKIGIYGIKIILKFFKKMDVPIILETPEINKDNDIQIVKLV